MKNLIKDNRSSTKRSVTKVDDVGGENNKVGSDWPKRREILMPRKKKSSHPLAANL